MSGFKGAERILKIMRDKRSIRNVSIIAHIDHGKTTLTDLLLARAGLIPYSLAGEARVLDYLEEEQRRGITIKSANISLAYNINGREYVINLVDTPGHVDFTGRVTRALRAVDGAVVLVDAVEGVMAQTEVVTRQALGERVKPVLFINKVDRLIRELRLPAEEIQKRILHIIQEFNGLIDLYGEPEFRDKWKVSISRGDVVIGSALHKWGLTLKTAIERGVRFSDIINMYLSGSWRDLQEIIPLHEAILRLIIEKIPSPVEAQKYRIPKIWRGDLSSDVGRAMLECDPGGPTAICVASVKVDPKEGLIATGRIFSGKIEDGDRVYLLSAGKECVVRQVSVYMGAVREHVGWMDSGNIVALSGLEPLRAGETIIDPAYREGAIPFERIQYVSEPVVAVSIEPKSPSDLQRLLNALNVLLIEDPNLTVTINRETGEYLLSGIGELHLDIAVKSIGEIEPGLEVIVSKPMISYRESVSDVGDVFTASSLNRLNKISVRVRPLDERGSAQIYGKIILSDENRNVLVDLTESVLSGECLEAIIDGFRWACRSGPLCGEPLRDLVVELVEARLCGEPSQGGYAQIMPAVRRAIIGSILTARPVLLEPIYGIQVSAPTERIGDVINLIVRRRGRISSVSDKGLFSVINGFIPVAESFGLADEMRAVSSGRAFWQSYFSHWERVPGEHAAHIIRSIRLRKGLSAEIPRAKDFMD
ncbi:MAG: GTP-binding protein [Candidatus Bathyarchaeia archaeon]|nr:GTP-binding protein [Candidatus Bathyarchaeota archaeon]